MDTSEEYVKMCRLAHEVQEAWIPAGYDKYAYHGGPGIVWTFKPTNEVYPLEQKKMTWLPRQDQLQDMMANRIKTVLFYNNEILSRWDPKTESDSTMEQLWLKLVMRREYKKEWNGEEWV